jgi:hypothetical protein
MGEITVVEMAVIGFKRVRETTVIGMVTVEGFNPFQANVDI